LLPGAINVGFYDGHAQQVRLERLWALSWHKDYQPLAAECSVCSKRNGLRRGDDKAIDAARLTSLDQMFQDWIVQFFSLAVVGAVQVSGHDSAVLTNPLQHLVRRTF